MKLQQFCWASVLSKFSITGDVSHNWYIMQIHEYKIIHFDGTWAGVDNTCLVSQSAPPKHVIYSSWKHCRSVGDPFQDDWSNGQSAVPGLSRELLLVSCISNNTPITCNWLALQIYFVKVIIHCQQKQHFGISHRFNLFPSIRWA
jgi:hypothetical protein